MTQTGVKFNDLYNLSKKINSIQPKEVRTAEDIDYERNKDVCTFAPNCKRFIDRQAPSTTDVNILEDKTVQKDVDRMKRAREEKERIKRMTERGIPMSGSMKKMQQQQTPTSANSRLTSA
jgi:hypothetical protein